ncbi:fibronectin type III domain protein [Prevotella sp. CAG:1124]|nr:fibronectin type III domain protein [Prevotella sp. CAG:1124]
MFENCKKVALAEVSTIVDELNKKAQEIDGACQWEVGEDGLPSLVFETSTGIGSITVEEDADGVYDVFDVTGKLVMKGARGTADLDRLARGVYIMNGKKYVIK